MRRSLPLLAAALFASGGSAVAAGTASPIVVELFTSEACSSCPPADAFLAELGRTRADVLPLDFHVTYWNNGGWRDPFSLDAATMRQDRYAAQFGDAEVYTPEMVIDGTSGLVGSDRKDALARIASEVASGGPPVMLRLTIAGGSVAVSAGPGSGRGTLVLVGFDAAHDTAVGGGENDGRRLHEVNVVRSIRDIGTWQGGALAVQAPRPAGARVAVLLEAEDGRILGAASGG